MMPELSSLPVPASWSERVNSFSNLLEDFENGGESLGVGSESNAFEWRCHSDGSSVWVSREGVAPVLLLTDTGITEVSLAFDQNMLPYVAYVAGGVSKWHWWDTLANQYTTTTLPGCRSPRCCSDEKTPLLSNDRDVVLTYLRGTSLYVRLQRDRYLIEYEKIPDPANNDPILESTQIAAFGMNTGRRLQWRFV